MDRLRTGAISWLGRVGEVEPPFLVLPSTLPTLPTKPRLCHDARFLNLWMEDKPFTLDTLNDLPRYVAKDSYQTVLDDKSGYDHILLSEDSRTFLEFSGEAGILPTTRYLSGGKYRLTFIIRQVSWPPPFFDQLEFLVFFTSMIDTMDNFKFR